MILFQIDPPTATTWLEVVKIYGVSLVLNVVLLFGLFKIYKQSREDRNAWQEQIEKDQKSYQDHVERLWEKRLEETKILYEMIESQTKSNDQLAHSVESMIVLFNKISRQAICPLQNKSGETS